MKVLVQGASGFVASYLIPQLSTLRATEVLCVDCNLPTVRLGLAQGVACQWIKADSLTGISGRDLDVVVSLAGVTDVDYALEEPGVAFGGNIGIALDLAEWLRTAAPHARCIYVSTDEVLGVSEAPLSPDAPLRATQPYAASKAAAETILHNYRDVYDLDIVTLRSCNLIGGRQRAFKLIPVAVQKLSAGHSVPIYGSGCQRREWMSVQDLCSAVLAVAQRSVPKGIYQAATGVHLSVNEVVTLVADALAMPLQAVEVADRRVHDACYAMDASRLHALGWVPYIDPREAIMAAAREMFEAVKNGNFELARN